MKISHSFIRDNPANFGKNKRKHLKWCEKWRIFSNKKNVGLRKLTRKISKKINKASRKKVNKKAIMLKTGKKSFHNQQTLKKLSMSIKCLAKNFTFLFLSHWLKKRCWIIMHFPLYLRESFIK